MDSAIYACLLLFVAGLVHNKAFALGFCGLGMLLWVVKLIVRRERPLQQPLVAPLFAVLVLSAISSALSPAPALSWAQMREVSVLIIAVFVAQNLRTFREIRTAVLVLLISTAVSLSYTAWRYGYGIGAKVVNIPPGSMLGRAGVIRGDIILAVNGHPISNPAGLAREITKTDAGSLVGLRLARGEWLQKFDVRVDRQALAEVSPLAIGRPPRARGTFAYTVTYADVLMQVGLLAWGLLLAAMLSRQRWKWTLLAGFILICVAIAATVTRATLFSLLLASTITLWMSVPRRRARTVSVAVVAVIMVAIVFWIHRERRIGIIVPSDPGTRYRVLMAEDGMRLIGEHPLFGIGMDSIKVLSPKFNIRAYRLYPAFHSHFHCTPVQIAAERGLPALAAVVWLMFLYFRLLLRLLKRVPVEDWMSRGIALGILAATIGIIGYAPVHYMFGGYELQMPIWFFMGTAIALERALAVNRAAGGVLQPSQRDEAVPAA